MTVRRYFPTGTGLLRGTAYPALQFILESFIPAQVVFFRVVGGFAIGLGIVVQAVYGGDN